MIQKSNQKQISIYLQEKDKLKINDYAKSLGLSLSAFLRVSALTKLNQEAQMNHAKSSELSHE